MRTTVRFATTADVQDLARLRWCSRDEDERSRESLPEFAERFSSWYLAALASDSWHAVVSQDPHANLVGCMYLRKIETVPVPGVPGRAWGYVTHAYVAEDSRRGGLGTQMLALLVTKAQTLDLQELQVWPSTGAVSLYTRAGFQSPEQQRAASPTEESSYVLALHQPA